MTASPPTVGIVVVTYESRAVLPGLLASLREYESRAWCVVVDNASPSGPPDPGETIELVRLDRNLGYGAACNAGARTFGDSVDVLAFLNPDVRLRAPSLTALADGLAARPRVGVATGPVVDGDGRRVASAWGPTSAARALWFATGWEAPRARAVVGRVLRRGITTSGASMVRSEMEVDGHVLGGAMLVRRVCFEEVNGFDERYFMYWEDADLCARARANGWKVAVLPCPPVMHQSGTSSEDISDDARWQWYVKGAEHFAERHLPWWRRTLLLKTLKIGRALR